VYFHFKKKARKKKGNKEKTKAQGSLTNKADKASKLKIACFFATAFFPLLFGIIYIYINFSIILKRICGLGFGFC